MADEDLVVRARLRDELSRPIRAVQREVAATARVVRHLGREASGVAGARGVGSLDRATSGLRTRLSGLHSTVASLSSRLGSSLVSGLRAATTGITLLAAAAAGLGINTAASIQTAQISLNRLVGGAREGADLFKYLTELDPVRPFDIGQLTQTATQLAAVGVSGDLLKKSLAGVTDVASATADPNGSLYATTRAISQMSSAGVVLAEELNQLVDAGVNVGPALQKAFGMGIADVRRANASGGAKLAAQPFIDALFGNAAGAGEDIATHTFRGLLSGVKSRAMLRLTEAFNPLLGILQHALPGVEEQFGRFVGDVAPALSGLVANLVPLVGGILRSAGPLLAVIFRGVGRLLDVAAPAFAALEPVVGELGGAITDLVTELVPVLPDVIRGFVLLVGILPDMVRLLGGLVPLVPHIVDLLDALLGFGPTRGIILGLLAALIGFNAIAGPIKLVWGMVTALQALRIAQAAAGGAGAAAGIPGAAGGALGAGRGLLPIAGAVGVGALGVAGQVGAMSDAAQHGAGVGNVLGGAASGAMVGGALGSVLPGVGTVIGAGVGAAVGGIGTWAAGTFGHRDDPPQPSRVTPTYTAPVDNSLTMNPGAVVIDARGMSEAELAALIPRGIEDYQRERGERGPRASRTG